MTPQYSLVADRANHRCEYCLAPEQVSNFPFEVEHIVPKVRGGANVPENLALSCRSCNLYKAAFVTGTDPASGNKVRLFHPRRSVWTRHFAFSNDTLEIVGRTPTGRATVSRLQMNSPAQRNARLQWSRLGLFP